MNVTRQNLLFYSLSLTVKRPILLGSAQPNFETNQFKVKKHFLLSIILFLCLSTAGMAQTQERLDAQFMLEDFRKLSHDAAQGRKTGTKGEN